MCDESKFYIIRDCLTTKNLNLLPCFAHTCVWRGFTHKHEMLPSSANYALTPLEESCHDRSNGIFLREEIQRLACYFDQENKPGRYPFEISSKITDFIYAKDYFPEENYIKIIKEAGNNSSVFPSEPFLQMMSWIQHWYGGTPLIDFSRDIYKALYFAVGKLENYGKDAYLYGLQYKWFQIHKDDMLAGFENQGAEKYQYDLYIPSYYKNDRIQNQEGLFLYQKHEVDENLFNGQVKHKNILDIQEVWEAEYQKHDVFKPANFSELPESYKVASVLLTITAGEKRKLKLCLDNMGITDEFMFAEVARK